MFDRLKRVAVAGILALAAPWSAAAIDWDGDGIPDVFDNCSQHVDSSQTDVGSDGFGNVCDPDFDGDLVVDADDVPFLGAVFGSSAPPAGAATDLDLDGVTGIPDALVLRDYLGGPPGPSGLQCAGVVPCP